MNRKSKYFILIMAGLMLLITALALITIPYALENSHDYNELSKFENETINKTIDELCKTGCTDYVDDWVNFRDKESATASCLKQCQNPEHLKEEMAMELDNDFQYRSKIHKFVGELYCNLRINCFSR